MGLDVLTDSDRATLLTACEKVVIYGEQVGLSPLEMIALLEEEATVRELLEFLAAQGNGFS
jgi:hypothetical protein